MHWTKFSSKQQRLFTWWLNNEYQAVVADGSIRSGKTLCMSVSFVMWAMSSFNNQLFGMCGKTIESLRRNVIVPLSSALEGIYKIRDCSSKNYIEISTGNTKNRFYIFGGKDESSYMLIQGITLAGVMFDEVALQPQSFVNQATARCSVDGSKFWFNCNPESPEHWFKTEWIDKAGERKALHLHFTMKDNLSLSDDIRRRYESMYAGVFYQRYIEGLWVKAEGRVYPMFDQQRHILRDIPKSGGYTYYVSIDYGTVNPCSMGLWAVDSVAKKAYRIREYYFDSRREKRQRTDEEYYRELDNLTGDLPVRFVIVDPSAASFIECIRRHGRFRVRPAVNDVLDGIRVVSSLLNNGMIAVHSSCKDSIREFGMYGWDDKRENQEKVLKEYDHAMDDIRYFCNTILRRDFKWVDWR